LRLRCADSADPGSAAADFPSRECAALRRPAVPGRNTQLSPQPAPAPIACPTAVFWGFPQESARLSRIIGAGTLLYRSSRSLRCGCRIHEKRLRRVWTGPGTSPAVREGLINFCDSSKAVVEFLHRLGTGWNPKRVFHRIFHRGKKTKYSMYRDITSKRQDLSKTGAEFCGKPSSPRRPVPDPLGSRPGSAPRRAPAQGHLFKLH